MNDNEKKDITRTEAAAAGYTLSQIDNNLAFLEATPDDGDLLYLALTSTDRQLFDLALSRLKNDIAEGRVASYQLIHPDRIVSSKIVA